MKMPIVGPVIQFVERLARTWMDAKLKEAESRAKIAEIRAKTAAEIEISQAQADINWNITQAEASKTSWKDEFWTLILAIPVVLAFVPGGDQYVRDGFAVLQEDVPDWYLYALGTAIAAAFGVRQVSNVIDKTARRDKTR